MTPDQFAADPFGGQPDPATTLVARLREIQPGFDGCIAGHKLALEAADALEAVTLELETQRDITDREIARAERAEARLAAAVKCVAAADAMARPLADHGDTDAYLAARAARATKPSIPTIDQMQMALADIRKVLNKAADGEETLMGALDAIHDLSVFP